VGLRGDAARAHSVGFSAYLVKPVRESELLDCLETVLSRTATTRAATEPEPTLVTRHTLAEQDLADRPCVLVAEDEPINQKVAVRMLKELGYTADVVTNGQTAIEAVAKKPYAAVLMDCRMPDMDGYLATAAIRAAESPGQRIPIIAMTADAMPEDRQKCLAAGMDDYVTKPVPLAALGTVLERLIRSAQEPADETVLDQAVFGDLRSLDPLLLGTLIDDFLSGWADRLAALRHALDRGALKEVAEAAHKLKGQARNLGIRPAAALAASLQTAAEQQDGPQAKACVDQLVAAFPAIRTRLVREQADLSRPVRR